MKKGKLLKEYKCPTCGGKGKTRLHIPHFSAHAGTKDESSWAWFREAEIRGGPFKVKYWRLQHPNRHDSKATEHRLILEDKSK